MRTVIITISEAVFTASSKPLSEKDLFSVNFRELLMGNKGKVMDNYLFNRKFTVSKYGLKMLCHVALICTELI